MNQVRIACVTSNYYLRQALLYVSSRLKREGSFLPEVKLVFFNDYRAFRSHLNDNPCYNGVVIDSCGNFFDLVKLFESLSQQFSDEEVTTHCAFLHDKKYLTTLMNDTQDESIVCIDKDVEINLFRHQFLVFIRRIESAMSSNLPAERCGQFRCYDFYKRKLTTPELSTLNDIIQGVSLVDIALTRNRSVKTITSHKINALKKLGVKSMSDLLVRR
ncbi:LuxR C-terminal-related transcriptional regulator [Serratia fonticola]|jgi:DNA-binding CsgD family transcriptional regulator|uniref:LuxR C-terminal-related transcriptional regulator n=1 Tax=Serratia fonticola TaxID=47917 RepID=UPI0020C6D1D3|nr:LuxR C-terminal-related transcriptional regulator [Serratia fonticola]